MINNEAVLHQILLIHKFLHELKPLNVRLGFPLNCLKKNSVTGRRIINVEIFKLSLNTFLIPYSEFDKSVRLLELTRSMSYGF